MVRKIKTMKSFLPLSLFLFCIPAWGTTPTKVESNGIDVYANSGGGNTTNKQQARCSNPSSSGDAIFVVGQYGNGANNISSIADYPSGSDTWVTDKQVNDVTNGQTAFILRLNNAPSGIRGATVTFNAAYGYTESGCILMNNINTTVTPTDGTCGQSTTSTTPLCGSAIGANGDELLYCVFMDTLPATPPTWTASAGMTLIVPQNYSGSACEYGNISAATNPSITSSVTGKNFVTIGVAYKTQSSGGAAPTGVYVPWVQNVNVSNFPLFSGNALSGTSFTFNAPCPSATNVIDIGWQYGSASAFTVSAVSSANPSLTWSHTTPVVKGQLEIGHFYATAVAGCGSTTTITLTVGGTPDGTNNALSVTVFYLQNVNGLDSNFPCNSSGSSAVTTFPLVISNSSCTTLAANEAITAIQQEDFQTVTNSSVSAGTIYDTETDLGQYEALSSYQDGGAAVIYTTTAQGYTISWTYSKYDAGQATVGNWAAQDLAWQPSSGGGGGGGGCSSLDLTLALCHIKAY